MEGMHLNGGMNNGFSQGGLHNASIFTLPLYISVYIKVC